MKGWSDEQDCDSAFFLHSDGVHRGGHPVVPVRLTHGQPANLSSDQLLLIFGIVLKSLSTWYMVPVGHGIDGGI